MNFGGLNPQQLEAVRHLNGPLLILAGAGTGKTRVITCRAAHLLERGIPPEQLLMMTFTNKAAKEMQERIAALIGREPARRVTAGTFHRFGANVLRRHIAKLGYSPRFAIAPESYQAGLVKELMGQVGATGEGYDPDRFQAMISRAKNALRSPQDLRTVAVSPAEVRLADVYENYLRRMRQMDLVDFDDLLVLIIELWNRFPAVLEAYRKQYRYLMVDEYQDTNAVQFQIVALLAGAEANLAVVGDDDQSIYGWRGANIENILRFEEHFPKAKVIRLEQNYRSTRTILDAANAVIARNTLRHKKKLWSGLDAGDKLVSLRVRDDELEARTVADVIRDWQVNLRCPWEDFALLYRSNHQSRLFELALRQAKIPYTIVGSKSFYERKEILDGLSLLQAAWNPRDDLSLLRILNVPPRGVGDKTFERLKEVQAQTHQPFQEILGTLEFQADLASGSAATAVRGLLACLEKYRKAFQTPGGLPAKIKGLFLESGYYDGLGRMYKPREDAIARQENLDEFVNAAAEFEKAEGPAAGLEPFLERFALLDTNDRSEDSGAGRGVTLMTIHAAKGLEFPIVVVVGMEHNLFPNERAVEEGNLDEERRLFYVAVTRARKKLVLTHCEKRRVRGSTQMRRPSPFLEELPPELVELHTPDTILKPLSREEAKLAILEKLRALKS